MLSILQTSYYPEPDSRIRDKVKVVLDLSNYATKNEKKSNFSALKAEVHKLDINKLVNVPTGFDN